MTGRGAPDAQAPAARCLLYGIGAQKAATTWLHDQLAAHPGVHLPPRKEIHYWDTIRAPYDQSFRLIAERVRLRSNGTRARVRRILSGESRSDHARAEALAAMLAGHGTDHGAYLDYLQAEAGGAAVVGDITPGYALLSRETFAEMAALHPGARFLFVLRDPVDRLLSGIRQTLRRALGGEGAGEALMTRALREAARNPHDPNRRRSDYAATLRELEAAVPRERVLCLFYETLGAAETAARLGAFLGIEGLALDAGRRVHAGRPAEWAPPAPLLAEARGALAETYDFVARRFGGEVPESWALARPAA